MSETNPPVFEHIRVVVEGEVVPCIRIGVERWTDRARRYMGWQDAFRLRLSAAAPRPLPLWTLGEIEIDVLFFRYRRAGDLDNLVKSVLDAANRVLFKDDRQVSRITAERIHCDKGDDTTVLVVRPLSPVAARRRAPIGAGLQ